MFVLVETNFFTEIAVAMDTVGVETLVEEPSTPRATSSPSMEQKFKEQLKPTIGMVFDTLTNVERFYTLYAHDNGFSVRVCQHKKGNEEILFKQNYCAREGYIKECKRCY
jgi:hypothetical protein